MALLVTTESLVEHNEMGVQQARTQQVAKYAHFFLTNHFLWGYYTCQSSLRWFLWQIFTEYIKAILNTQGKKDHCISIPTQVFKFHANYPTTPRFQIEVEWDIACNFYPCNIA